MYNCPKIVGKSVFPLKIAQISDKMGYIRINSRENRVPFQFSCRHTPDTFGVEYPYPGGTGGMGGVNIITRESFVSHKKDEMYLLNG